MPAYSHELNPVERLWLYLKETCLSLFVFPDKAAIIEACCQAWNRASENLERIISLCKSPWIKAVSS